MSTNETYPHRAVVVAIGARCRCKATTTNRALNIGDTFGENCPAAMREALAQARRERDNLDKLVGDIQNTVRASIVQALTDLGIEGADRMIDGGGSDGDELDLTEAELEQGFSAIDELVGGLRARVAELEAATPGPHITPALMRRIEALGFAPGSGEPVDWLIRDHLRLRKALNDAEAAHGATIAERDELAAILANERGDADPPVRGWKSVRVYGGDGEFRPGWRRGDVVVVRFDQEKSWRVYDVDGTMVSPVLDDDGNPVEAPTARAAMIAASAAGGAK